MSLRDEINSVKRTKEEYERIQSEERSSTRNRKAIGCYNGLKAKLEYLLKDAASKGQIDKGVISGTLVFSLIYIDDDSRDGFHTAGMSDSYLRVDHKRNIKGFLGITKSGFKVTPEDPDFITEVYNYLVDYANQNGILLGELYIQESSTERSRNKTKKSSITKHKADKKGFFVKTETIYQPEFRYAIDYSMHV